MKTELKSEKDGHMKSDRQKERSNNKQTKELGQTDRQIEGQTEKG